MKRQLFVLLMVLTVATGTALMAQTPSQLPPSQQVDQSGTPETGTGVDVDVDAGRNAEDGVVDVDVNRTTDADTSAVGNDPQPNLGTTTTDTMDTTTDTASDDLPDTGSSAPLAGLIGLLSLGVALGIRAAR